MARPPAPATLPADRAFVVHFRTTAQWRRRFAGRAEHLSSGTFVDFGSLRELLRFFARFLDADGAGCGASTVEVHHRKEGRTE
jgi:hypothetical protein